jgi:hypothetical protein
MLAEGLVEEDSMFTFSAELASGASKAAAAIMRVSVWVFTKEEKLCGKRLVCALAVIRQARRSQIL